VRGVGMQRELSKLDKSMQSTCGEDEVRGATM